MSRPNHIHDVLVIGAGPAGIMAAIASSETGADTILLEKNPNIGKKILATGNGRCNITNLNIDVSKYYGDPKLAINIINKFDQNQTIAYFEALGLLLKEEDRGRIFPRTNQASSVVKILEDELRNKKVDVRTNCEIKKINKTDDIFNVVDNQNNIYSCKRLIITTGGKAAHQFGSSGDGLFWAKNLGHTVTPLYAGLAPIETENEIFSTLSGLRVEGRIRLDANSKKIIEKSGDILFTHYGLSGPAVMSLSRHIATLLDKQQVILRLDFFPDKDEKELDQILENTFKTNNTKIVKNALSGLLPHNLIPVLLKTSSIDETKKSSEISKVSRRELIKNLKGLEIVVTKICPLKEAQVTAGGIDTNEINKETLESKIIKGLFFAGEIMNVDADSGGFNLQWCWSSGKIAGIMASKSIN